MNKDEAVACIMAKFQQIDEILLAVADALEALDKVQEQLFTQGRHHENDIAALWATVFADHIVR